MTLLTLRDLFVVLAVFTVLLLLRATHYGWLRAEQWRALYHRARQAALEDDCAPPADDRAQWAADDLQAATDSAHNWQTYAEELQARLSRTRGEADDLRLAAEVQAATIARLQAQVDDVQAQALELQQEYNRLQQAHIERTQQLLQAGMASILLGTLRSQ